MPWVQLQLTVPADETELVEDLLMAQGAVSVTFEDAADQPLFEPDPGTTPLWDATRVIGLFDEGTGLEAIRESLAQAYHEATQSALGPVATELLADRDWERSWMEDFKPIRFGDRLWICPSWHSPPDPGAVNLMLDPGLAFGTGTHPTTALCLRWLDRNLQAGSTVIDYGCGSGVLAIAALLLGARHATGIDTDPQALEASRENARRNDIPPDRLSLYLPEDQPDRQADILLANILAQPLGTLAPHLANAVHPGGRLVLSGILSTQADQLLSIYERWFDLAEPEEEEGWVLLHGIRRPE